MPNQRRPRSDDPPGIDRTDERTSDSITDWRGAPRWALIVGLIASIGINTMLGTMVVGLVVDRFKMIEASRRDDIRDAMAQISQTQLEQGIVLKRHEESLKDMASFSARMTEIQAELKYLNERLRRKGF